MKNKNLIFKNNLKLIKKKREVDGLKLILKNYSINFTKFKNDLDDNKKTAYVLNKKFNFSFKFTELRKFKKFQTIAIIGMGGSILGIEAIYKFLEKKIKKRFIFLMTLMKKN